jgi:SAM-dependent methyltransferase
LAEKYDSYLEHFLKMNSPTRAAFDDAWLFYSAYYKERLPRDKDAAILDVGCGMGHFLYFLQKEGYTNYCGIDVSTSQVEFVRKNISRRVQLADAFDYLSGNDLFDVIVANDVLEHIPKTKTLKFLGLVHDTLVTNGVLFIRTPNMSNPFSLSTRYMDFTHEVGFTRLSLEYVLSISGFDMIEIEGAPYGVARKSLKARLGEQIARGIIDLMSKAFGYGAQPFLEVNLIAICKKATNQLPFAEHCDFNMMIDNEA